MPADPTPPGRPARAFSALAEFLRTEAASGALLVAAAVIAIAWANSPWNGLYEDFTHAAHDVVNEGLMTLFFFVVGLEIKRELDGGELGTWRKASLPVVAAVGGMVVPALLYVAFNSEGAAGRGWGVPMATDIAFAVGVMSLVGRHAPSGLKLFLLALAIADDIGAVVVIAVFYSTGVEPLALAGAAVLLAAMAGLWRFGARALPVHLALGFGVWLAFYQSGVHPTLAGVILGLLAPAGAFAEKLERWIHPVSSYAVIPVFALVNAGVELGGGMERAVVAGVVTGLVIGKTAGITAASWLAVRARVADLPDGVTWPHIVGGAALAGIGFTVSLFVAELAFTGDEDLARSAAFGVLVASVMASLLGAGILRAVRFRRSAS